ncbi:MAG: hypothetical protein JXM70_09265 [Pirellulales bacterium]|nr:hypothetical protein [Pirellulales bacterium]
MNQDAIAHVASDLRSLMRRYINAIRPNKLFEEVNAEFSKTSSEDLFATSMTCRLESPKQVNTPNSIYQ